MKREKRDGGRGIQGAGIERWAGTVRRNIKTEPLKSFSLGTSVVVQWIRICLPMQGTQVRALVREDFTCHGATRPVCHNFWACALQPKHCNYWSPHAWSLCSEIPETTTMRSPRTATRESPHAAAKAQSNQKWTHSFFFKKFLFRNANQNYSEVPTTSHQPEWPSLKSLQITHAGEGVETLLHCF